MSSGSESDDEYVPGEPEQVSEEESADEETDMQFEKEQEHKTKKRKAAQESNSKKKRRTRNTLKEPSPEPVRKEPKVNLNPEEEKKRQEDLWAMFLDGTDSKPKVASKVEAPTTSRALIPVAEKAKTLAKTSSGDDDKAREKRIFEFAGETIVVENNVIKEKLKTPAGTAEDRSQRWALLVDVTIPHDENLVKAEKDKLSKYLDLAHEATIMWDVDSTIIVPIVVSANGLIAKSPDQHLKRLSLDGWINGSKLVPPLARGRGSGLADVLGQLNKKNRLSTLEKSKLDWETYKKDEDINEEIQTHNKGKNGYLDRQDFLERADHRQFEIERDLRLNRRSNR